MSIIAEAREIIDSQFSRENHQRIADLWNAYLNGRRALIAPEDVAVMMILLKVARLGNGYHRDSVVDIAGYAGVLEKMQLPEKGVIWKRDLNEFPAGVSVWDAETWAAGDMDAPWEGEGPDSTYNYAEYGPFTSTPPKRRWECLSEVPHDVKVADRDGDVWAYYDGDPSGWGFEGSGWGFEGRPARRSADRYIGPFTEVLPHEEEDE